MYFGACEAVETSSELKGFTDLTLRMKCKDISDTLLSPLRAAFLLLIILEIQHVLSLSSQFVVKFKH